MLKVAIVAVASLLILAAAILGYMLFIGLGGTAFDLECETAEDCRMSLCDCECHPEGKTPEELQGIVCGKNCLSWYNVTGCDCVTGTCTTLRE